MASESRQAVAAPGVADLAASEVAFSKSRSFWSDATRRLVRHHPVGFWGGFVIIAIIALSAILAPLIQPAPPNYQNASAVQQAPSLAHPFGTDNIGRDILSRVVHGARISLGVSISAVSLGVAAATIVGLVSAYFGGLLDLVIQRLVDIMMAFPGLILILIMVAVFGASLQNVIFAIAILLVAAPSRLVRAQVLGLKQEPYIEAARTLGCSHFRILTRHILPNMVHIVIVMVSINIGFAMILEASLSFLGLGVPAPAPTWGNMIAGPGTFYIRSAPWMVLFPGLALSLTVYAFNMLGDALRDVLDPRLRSL